MSSPDQIEFVPTEKLLLDKHNPRLTGMLSADSPALLLPIDSLEAQNELLRVIWESMAIDELAASISASGFYGHEPLLVEPLENDREKFVVIEGNRRLATVRLLLSEKHRRELKATDLPLLKGGELEALRELPAWKTSREKAWQAIGFKHVHGPRRWTSYAKAEYIFRLREEQGLDLPEIAKKIGDNHKTVTRLYRALTVVRQAEEWGVFHRDDRRKKHFSFSHLYVGLGYSGIAGFIGLKPEAESLDGAPVPVEKKEELGELLVWIYGSEKANRDPIVQSQNPDIHRLNQALQKRDGLDVLRAVSSLEEAAEAAEGDRAVFYDCLLRAKIALEKALGKTAGYKGDPELLRIAEALHGLVENLVRLMDHDDARRKARGKK